MYDALKKLKAGEVLNLGGILVKIDEGDLKDGDLYVAERNTGPHLLTARFVDHTRGCVFPTTIDYPFDLYECIKVCEA